MTNRKIQYWVIPPDKNSEFVACMEDVLNVYSMPYDPDFPVLCMDEHRWEHGITGRDDQ